ncbi:MAG TPA: hypothetical protein VN881_10270 [Candidatus Acidoferrales bacterium]|jgi:hypothetical protein|nr:hypothetical protein [Candidatus Acidoferrales bacterium]
MQVFNGLSLLALWANKARAVVSEPPAIGFEVEVPFAFVVGTGTFSAGAYRFEALHSPTPGICVLAVRGGDGRVYKLAVTDNSPSAHGHRSKLIFHEQRGKYFLTEAWLEGRRVGLQLYRSIQELDWDEENSNNEVILLVEPDKYGRTVYVIEDFGCTA